MLCILFITSIVHLIQCTEYYASLFYVFDSIHLLILNVLYRPDVNLMVNLVNNAQMLMLIKSTIHAFLDHFDIAKNKCYFEERILKYF